MNPTDPRMSRQQQLFLPGRESPIPTGAEEGPGARGEPFHFHG
jgi:hypothetical protein